jgi:hypothetical protein
MLESSVPSWIALLGGEHLACRVNKATNHNKDYLIGWGRSPDASLGFSPFKH